MGGAVISWCLAAAGLCLAVVFGAADAVAQDDREHALVLKMGPAIYTRKSTEYNLELAFNSLDAQREACEAYIKKSVGPEARSECWQASGSAAGIDGVVGVRYRSAPKRHDRVADEFVDCAAMAVDLARHNIEDTWRSSRCFDLENRYATNHGCGDESIMHAIDRISAGVAPLFHL